MRKPPPVSDLGRYPVISVVGLLAIGISLLAWGGCNVENLMMTPQAFGRRPWQLFTCIFIHVGVMHLVFNVYWLWVFGSLIEETFGHLRTAALILVLAVGAGAAEFAVARGGVGLSGVGYGLITFLWVLSRRDARFADAVDRRTINLFVAWFIICVGLTYLGTPIGNVAHGAGAVLGAVIGMAAAGTGIGKWAFRALTVILMIAILGLASVGRTYVNFTEAPGYDLAGEAYEAAMSGDQKRSAELLESAIKVSATHAEWWYNLGVSYQHLNRYDKAYKAYSKAVELAPKEESYRQARDGVAEFK